MRFIPETFCALQIIHTVTVLILFTFVSNCNHYVEHIQLVVLSLGMVSLRSLRI